MELSCRYKRNTIEHIFIEEQRNVITIEKSISVGEENKEDTFISLEETSVSVEGRNGRRQECHVNNIENDESMSRRQSLVENSYSCSSTMSTI